MCDDPDIVEGAPGQISDRVAILTRIRSCVRVGVVTGGLLLPLEDVVSDG